MVGATSSSGGYRIWKGWVRRRESGNESLPVGGMQEQSSVIMGLQGKKSP